MQSHDQLKGTAALWRIDFIKDFKICFLEENFGHLRMYSYFINLFYNHRSW